MAVDVDEIYKSTWEHYQKAKSNVIKRILSLNIVQTQFQILFLGLRQIN